MNNSYFYADEHQESDIIGDEDSNYILVEKTHELENIVETFPSIRHVFDEVRYILARHDLKSRDVRLYKRVIETKTTTCGVCGQTSETERMKYEEV